MDGDKFGWSPDVGAYVIRDHRMYAESGAVFGPEEMCFIRSMPIPPPGLSERCENYADWTDERRATELAQRTKVSVEARRKELEAKKARELLAEEAKRKLTEDEYDAVFDLGFEQGRR